MKVLSALCVLFLFCFSGCKEDNESLGRDFPSLHTLSAESINEDGATFIARIEKNNDAKILKAGFIWSISDNFDNSKDTVFVDVTNKDTYSSTINYALPANNEISFCGYLQTADYNIMGNVETFISKGCNPPQISDYYPKHGLDGDTVTFEGENLTSITTNYSISFGKYTGRVIYASKNKVIATIPNNYEIPGQSSIALKIFDNEYSVGDFILDSLKIIDINSSSFNIAESVLEITLNDKILRVDSFFIGDFYIDETDLIITDNTISFSVPPDSPSGEQEISVIVNNKKTIYNENVVFNSPWTEKSSCPENLAYKIVPNGFACNGNIIFNVPLGTVVVSRGGNNVFWEYSPDTDEWSLIYEMEELLRYDIFSFAINENYYWGGGFFSFKDGLSINKYSYNKNEEVLNVKGIFEGAADCYLSPFSIGVDMQGYIFGGIVSTIYPELLFFKYSETNNTWEKQSSFDNAFDYKYWYGMTGFEIDGKIYLGTGATDKGLTNEFWCYDPDDDSWTQLPVFPSKERCFAVGFSINGKGYIGMGSREDWYIKTSNSLSDIWEFDPNDNSWREVATFPGGKRSGAAAVVSNSKAYVCFGNEKNDLWEFEPFSE